MVFAGWRTNDHIWAGFAQLSEHEHLREVFALCTDLIRKGFEITVSAGDENVGSPPFSCPDDEFLRSPRSVLRPWGSDREIRYVHRGPCS